MRSECGPGVANYRYLSYRDMWYHVVHSQFTAVDFDLSHNDIEIRVTMISN